MKGNITIILFLLGFNGIAQISSPFNKRTIIDTSANYSFIVSGHFYGDQTNNSSYPASTILANIDLLNTLQPSFLICLGDLFLDVDDYFLSNYQKSLFDKLNFPMFNAVGNHDLAHKNIYEQKFGKEYFAFKKGEELFIILNTELNDGSIKNEQLDFFKNELSIENLVNINNVFIFCHRAIWAENIEKYKNLFKGNTRSIIGSSNFNSDLLPLIATIPNSKNVFWMTGSSGGGPASFFYDKNEKYHITFIHSAIRNTSRDAVLQVSITNGKVVLNGISLVGKDVKKIEEYNLDFWQTTKPEEEKFNFRLLPMYIKGIVFSLNFWIGIIAAIILIAMTLRIKKWKTKK
jgi:hypothetical protein